MAYDTEIKQFAGVAAADIHCNVCDINFAVPQSMRDRWYRERGMMIICCPNGHSLVPAGKSDADRLREELERATARAANWRSAAEAREREIIARKGHATRLRKRIAAGVCPCCQRTFRDLARHMAGQHPDYAEAEA